MSFTCWLASLKARVVVASARRHHSNSRRTTARQRSLLLEPLEERLAPATLLVNTVADNTTADTVLSLREASLLVNNGGHAKAALGRSLTASEASQISGTFGADDTIEFSSALSGDTITLNGSALAISANVTISGLGASNLAISGNNQSQVLTVAAGADVNLASLSILDGNNGGSGGGGIDNRGTLTMSHAILSGNTGGGIVNYDRLTVSNSDLAGNAGSAGGGLVNFGDLTVSHSTLSNNLASGIYNSGTLTVSDSTLSGNAAYGDGGGIENFGTLTVSNSTLAGNSAHFNGSGGGIANEAGGTLTVSNSTLSNNTADVAGGGIAIEAGSHATLNNTIVANSISNSDLYLGSATLTGSYDLIGDGSALSNFTHSLQGNPLLAPLGNYGGPTQTMALLPGSPALDAGSNSLAVDTLGNPLTTDQRGEPRLVGAAVDLGAFESQGFTLSATSGSKQSAAGNTNFAAPLTVTVTANNSLEPVNGGVVTFAAPSAGASATLSANPATISGGSASVTATANASVGSYTVTASAAGAGTSAAFDLTNTSPPPVVNAIAGQLVADGGTLSFTVAASSPDGSPLTFALAAGAPAGATINAQSGAFSWSPSEFNGIVPGSYTLTVTAAESDAPDHSGAATFTVTVGPSSTDLGTGLVVRTAVANGLTQSTEFYSNFVTAAYNKYLGRAPEASGLAYWVNLMQRQGLTDEQLEAGFIGSQEFLADHGGGGAPWVQSLYETLLGRLPQASEVQYWVNNLNNGETPQQVALGFTTSQERETQRVQADYQQYLGRGATTTEVSYWVNVFLNGGSNEQVNGGFLGSQEYFQQHGNNVVDWLFASYRAVLGRLPDANGYQYWLNQLQ